MSDVVQGVEQLNVKFGGMIKNASGSQLKTALMAGGLVIQVPAQAKAPVLTGNLRRSIHTEAEATGPHSAAARVGTDVEYGPHVEFGTSRQRAQPYLRPAYDENRNAAVSEVAAVLKELTTP